MPLVNQRDTFRRLIQHYDLPLRRLARAYLVQEADREDLFQEIAMAIWQALPKFRGESSERTWIYRIAHNTAVSKSTKLRRTGHREQQIPDAFDSPSAASRADQNVLSDERRHLLITAIRGLPAIDRQIALLHLEGLSYSEIEEIAGLSESAIASRLTRIRDKLKERMQGREGESQ